MNSFNTLQKLQLNYAPGQNNYPQLFHATLIPGCLILLNFFLNSVKIMEHTFLSKPAGWTIRAPGIPWLTL